MSDLKSTHEDVFVTVFTTVYNGAEYLKEAINSVLFQSHQNFEYIIINDGSIDTTSDIIKSYTDSRIKAIHFEVNKGNRKAANHALNVAKGKYFFRMDADDISLRDRLKDSIAFLEVNPEVGLFGGQLQLFGAVSRIWNYPTNEMGIKFKMLFGTPVAQATSVLRMDIIKGHNLKYAEDGLSYAEDLDFFHRIAKHTICANTDKIMLKYRRHPENITLTLKGKGRELNTPVYAKILTDFGIVNVTDSDVRLHLLLNLRFLYDLTVEDIRKIYEWKEQLIARNREKGYLEDTYFQESIEKLWNRLFFATHTRGIRFVKSFISLNKKNKLKLWRIYLKYRFKKSFSKS